MEGSEALCGPLSEDAEGTLAESKGASKYTTSHDPNPDPDPDPDPNFMFLIFTGSRRKQ